MPASTRFEFLVFSSGFSNLYFSLSVLKLKFSEVVPSPFASLQSLHCGGPLGRISSRKRTAPPPCPLQSILSRQDSTRDTEKTGNYVRELKTHVRKEIPSEACLAAHRRRQTERPFNCVEFEAVFAMSCFDILHAWKKSSFV